MSFFVLAFSGAVSLSCTRAVSRSHASWVAASIRRHPLYGPLAHTIQIRPAAGNPVECWGRARGRWVRVTA